MVSAETGHITANQTVLDLESSPEILGREINIAVKSTSSRIRLSEFKSCPVCGRLSGFKSH